MSTRDFSWGKGGRCVRLTTYHPCSAERQANLGLNLPGIPWATSACCGMTFTFIAKLMHDTAYIPITYWKRESSILLIFIVRRHRYFDLIIFTWDKASSQKPFIQNMLSNEDLWILLRRLTNFIREQTAAAIDRSVTTGFILWRTVYVKFVTNTKLKENSSSLQSRTHTSP